MDDFQVSVAVSALFALFLLISSEGGAPLYALFFFALSMAGYFCLGELHKAGMKKSWAPIVFVFVVSAAFFAASLSFGAFFALGMLSAVPAAFCLPALVTLVRMFTG